MIYGPRGLVRAACFYTQTLGLADQEFDLEISRSRMPKSVGICVSFGNGEYEIHLDPRRYGRETPIYEILAHEMVHLKQYITGQLIEVGGGYVMWEDRLTHDNIENYLAAPWEKEAFGRQKELYRAWRKESNELLRRAY